ncbi:MAG: endonuclease NucS [Rhodobacteraceae bacterium]|nr:endonuclease NucS [Paracoccaceae bacterium]
MTEELRLWSISESGEAELLVPLQQMPTELAFEDLLVQNPEILDPDIELVGRQTPTQSGWLDLLAVDRDGRLVVYELKRGTLTREAVAQVLDYASSLDAMSASDLAKHIADRSGNDGIQGIDGFQQWYADNFGGDDLSRLLPPRMVLVGMGIDPVAERMARFISGGPVDLSVVTFHGFTRGNERLLARQLEVAPETGGRERRGEYATAGERRKTLRKHLTDSGHANLFDQIHGDIRALLPERGVRETPGSKGISFQMVGPNKSKAWPTYFGVQAGYLGDVCSVSILPAAIDLGGDALERLRASVGLHEWPHGGYVCDFQSEEEWTKHRDAVLKFVRSVMTNRSHGAEAPG